MADSPSSQLAYIQLGLAALGYVDSGAGPTPPAGPVPDMSTWFVPMNQPGPIIIEIVSY